MKRLFWIGVGAAAAVVTIRRSRDLIDSRTPPGVKQAAGVVVGLGGALRAARSEFSAGLAEREAELRHALLGDADIDAARERTSTRRAERSERKGRHADPATDLTSAPAPDPTAKPTAAPRAEDPDDGDLGYSF